MERDDVKGEKGCITSFLSPAGCPEQEKETAATSSAEVAAITSS